MSRYTEKQKLAAVTAYRNGAGGLRATASAHDVGVDSLRAWIAAYEANGKAGLVAKRRTIYDLDFKLKVLRRMQDEGQSCRQCGLLQHPAPQPGGRVEPAVRRSWGGGSAAWLEMGTDEDEQAAKQAR